MSRITVQLDAPSQGDSAVRAAKARLQKLCADLTREQNGLLLKSDELRARLARLTRYSDTLLLSLRAQPDTETELLYKQSQQLCDTCARLLRFTTEQIAYAQKGTQFIVAQSHGLEQVLGTRNETQQKLAEWIRRYGAIHAVKLL